MIHFVYLWQKCILFGHSEDCCESDFQSTVCNYPSAT